MKKYYGIVLAAIFALGCLVGMPEAHALSPETELLLQLLEKKGVITEGDADALRREVEAAAPSVVEKEEMKAQIKEEITEELETERGALSKIRDHIDISGLVEVEASSGNDFEDTEFSDIVLATVELGFDAEIHDWVNAHVLLLYEEDDTELDVDEGTITVGNPEVCPGYVTAGKMYVPFGNFESHMISDPLTLEVGETNESAVQVGVDASGFYASLYAFNGDINEHQDGHDDQIEGFGGNVGYAFENDSMGIDVGIDYISNIGDSDLVSEFVPEEIQDYVPGYALHAILNIGPVGLIGEYVGAADDFEAAELSFGTGGAQPTAWNLEAGFTFELGGKESTVALGYQRTDEALALELPEARVIGSFGIEVYDHTTLSIEWAHDEDYDESDGGTGKDADVGTAQLAVEF
jgi:hypothetical protein